METLKTVQNIAKVMKVFALLGMIFGFVGAGGSLIGAAVYFAFQYIDEPEIFHQLSEFTNYGGNLDICGSLLADMVLCLGSAIVASYTYRYLKGELECGTPFTDSGAKELMYLGIRMISYPLGAVIISTIICECFKIEKSIGNETSLTLGVVLILISFVFKYGAELENSGRNE